MSDVINSPTVQPIFWGTFYSPFVVQILQSFLSDIVAGTYMNGLAQYGIKRGRLLPPARIHDPAPATLDDRKNEIRDTLLGWLNRGLVRKPAVNEESLVYLIIPPTVTNLLFYYNDDDPTGLNVGGWHYCTQYNDDSSRADVVYSIIKTYPADKSTIMKFLNGSLVAQKIAHELIESFNDPFLTGRAELGDGFAGNTYTYKGKWLVQQYLSVWDGGPINGEQAVSIKHFLSAIGANPAAGVAALGIKNLTVDVVADFIANH
jgi:hypothetical protein